MPRHLVIIESPYRGDIAANVDYARIACRDSYDRGEIPFASHLLYPQFLDDNVDIERRDGINFGYVFWQISQTIVFYTDLGWSPGMEKALQSVVNTWSPAGGRSAILRTIYRVGTAKAPEPCPQWLREAYDRGWHFTKD